MKERVTKTFNAEGQTSDWISSMYENNDGVIDVGLEADSDWKGILLIEKRYKEETDMALPVDTMIDDIQFAITDPIPGAQYRLKCILYESGECEGRIER